MFDAPAIAKRRDALLVSESPAAMRAKIVALEAAMRAAVTPDDMAAAVKALPLDHSFIPGCYARSLTIPAGTLIVGKIHRFPCFNFVNAGSISVLTEDGAKTIHAPAFFRSEAGVKRVGYTHADTIWITVHPTTETDPDKLETELTFESYEAAGLIEAQDVAP